MATQARKMLLISVAVAVAVAFALAYVPAEDDTEPIRHVSDEEFRQIQAEVWELRIELKRLQSEGADGSEKGLELKSKIDRLVPILEKHKEQQFAKHYIEPARKAQMELAESAIRDGVGRLGFDSYAVNLNTLTKTIEVVTSDPAKNGQVRALIDRYASEDIPVTLENGNFTVVDGPQMGGGTG